MKAFIKLLLFMAAASAIPILLNAQSTPLDTSIIKPGWGNLDYSLPESPAFFLLGSSPSTILKPTSVRTAAISVGNYFFTTGSVIPKSLGVEFSPLLMNPSADLNNYNKNKFFYRMRISGATNLMDNGGYQVSEGIRFTLIDKSDLRTYKPFIDTLQSWLNKDVSIRVIVITQYSKTHNISEAELYELLSNTESAEGKKISIEIDSIVNTQAFGNPAFDPYIADYRDKIKQRLWNAPIWEIAFAGLQSSSDSLIKNFGSALRFGVWSSGAYPLGKKGQLLGGIRASTAEDSTSNWTSQFSLAARIYYGVNAIRGYAQYEGKFQTNSNSTNLSAGCEFNITNGLWGDFGINIIIENSGEASYVPGLSLKYGTPEKTKAINK
jgi:hypothetical protein